MFWEEEENRNEPFVVSEDVVDLVYGLSCKHLPLDHAYALSTAIRQALPWIDDEPLAGIHLIHGAESGNGWMRPEDPTNEVLHLSKRSRMTLRVPGHRIDDAGKLTGVELLIDGHKLVVGKAKTHRFSTLPTQFARYVVVPGDIDHQDEEAFMYYAAEQLKALQVPVRKLMCGRAHALQCPDGDLYTRSIMLADLKNDEAVRLQQHGIGTHRKMGCGLFMPHRGISAVHEVTDDKK